MDAKIIYELPFFKIQIQVTIVLLNLINRSIVYPFNILYWNLTRDFVRIGHGITIY